MAGLPPLIVTQSPSSIPTARNSETISFVLSFRAFALT